MVPEYEPKPLLLATDKIRRGEWQRAVTQIGACKRLIAIVAASGQMTTDAQRQLTLETQLRRMLEEMRV
jgi:hypothetical protein